MEMANQLNKRDIELLEPLLREKRDEDQHRRQEKRQKAAEQIVEIKTQATETRVKIQNDLKAAKEEVKALKDELREKEMVAAQLDAELWSESFRAGEAVKRHQAILLDTYDKQIDEALEYFRKKLNETRKVKTSTQSHRAETDVVNLEKKLTTFCNVNSIKRTLEYYQACIQEFEDMRFVPEYDPAKFEELKRKAPDPLELDEFNVVKQLGGSVETVWEKTLPTDSQHDWTMKKLLGKVEKLLKTPSILSKRQAADKKQVRAYSLKNTQKETGWKKTANGGWTVK